jgi:transcriptional regulator with XRE-family HTH domain
MLGQRIRQLRREKSLTLQQVAQSLGVTRACVSKWETGASQPDLTRLGELAAVLGLSTSELVSTPSDDIGRGSKYELSAPPTCYPVVSLSHGTPLKDLISQSTWHHPSPRTLSAGAFFVALSDYMVAHFGLTGVPREALLLVEPAAQAHSGDLVLTHSKTLGYQVLAARENGGQLEHVSLGIKLSHLGPISDATVIGVVLESIDTQDLRGFALRLSPQLLFA